MPQPIFKDILPPADQPKTPPCPALTPASTPRRPRRFFPFLIFFFVLFLAAALGVGFVGYKKILAIRSVTMAQLRATTEAVSALNVSGASNALAPLARQAERVNSAASIFAHLSPTIDTARKGLSALATLATSTLHAFGTIDDVSRHAFRYAFRGGGSKLLALLQSLSADFITIRTATDELRNSAALFRIPLPHDTLTIGASLGNAEALMTRVLDVLRASAPQHLLLLFQNPSEIRPSGGFLGSYADIVIHGGNITAIDVRDIYDPDGQLPIKILAPRALQRVSPRWGARDANWFFDFPTSAANVLAFLEQSKIYSERDITFIGAIAVNVPVILDFLAATGPIALPDYDLAIDAQNFLATVQREVESGDDNKAGRPKHILRVLTPLLLGKLADLDDAQKRTLVTSLRRRIDHKDLQFYARDRALETYLQALDASGALYAPETVDYNDYFAFVRANIGGGKTDILVDEAVTLESTIDGSGVVHNIAMISRAHRGDTEQVWWYRMANRLFFQLLTPYGSLLHVSRGHDEALTPTVTRETYSHDPAITAIESTLQFPQPFIEQFTQSGKTTFAGWLTTPLAQEKTLTLEYQLPERVTLEDGARYRVVIERQSGSNEKFRYTLHAPIGFIWKENNTHDFIFASDDLNGRTILEATLGRQ